MPYIIIHNTRMNFEEKSLPYHLAKKIMDALNYAYMNSFPISSAPYKPTVADDHGQYMTACKTVLDNLLNVADSKDICNACLYTLKQ